MKKKSTQKTIPDYKKARSAYKKYHQQYDLSLKKMNRRIHNLFLRNKFNFTVKYRLKTFESYFEKLLRLHSNNEPLLITDILGMRIICPFLEDIDDIVKLISDKFPVTEVESKGSEHSFREFGYDSTHLLVNLSPDPLSPRIPHTKAVCEIQLRTILQEAWAEIEHELIYKANFSLLNAPIKRKLASLNASLTLSDIIFQEIRDYQQEIQLRGDKRRESLQEKIEIADKIEILDSLDPKLKKKRHKQATPFKPKSQLEAMIFEALEAHSSNDFDKSIRIYTQILKTVPNNQVRSIIHNHRGMAYFVLSKYKEAIKDFTRAIKYNPKNLRIFNNRGLVYRTLNKFDKALEDFASSLKINSYQVEAYYSRALTYYDLKDFPRALEDCEKILSIKPDYKPVRQLKKFVQAKIFNG